MTTPFHSPAVDAELDQIATRLRQSSAIVRSAGRRSAPGGPEGQGAAVVWSADGLLATNAHVARADRTLVDLADGRRLTARTIARDPRHDLAVLRVDPGATPLVPAERGDPSALRPGTMVLAFGHPLGISNSLALGVYHGTRAPLLRHLGAEGRERLLCADIRLAPGNSGGPLADAAGRVVGINTLVAGGLGYAVPIDRAARLIDALAPRPRLGVTVRAVQVRPRGAPPSPALLVLEVAAGSVAERAGILAGDVLFTLDGAALREPSDLASALAGLAADRPAPLVMGRAGRRRTLVLAAGLLADRSRWAA
jgi:serine protease Do